MCCRNRRVKRLKVILASAANLGYVSSCLRKRRKGGKKNNSTTFLSDVVMKVIPGNSQRHLVFGVVELVAGRIEGKR